jgi:hypothetical protein
VDSNSAGELNDEPLSQEIRLLGELVVAASGTTRRLTQDEVDQLLGLAQPANPGAGGDGQAGSGSVVTSPTWRTSGTSS